MTAGESFFLPGPAGRLEALLNHPPGKADSPSAVALVCHPHPLYHGAMTNKVTYMLARTLSEAGAVTLRFNFRGVGRSEGSFDEGMGETADTLAAIEWLRREWPERPLWLAGFSFGAYVALRASSQSAPALLITVAPAVERFDTATLQLPQCPWLLIQGEDDEVVSPKAVLSWARSLRHPPRIVELPDVGHFFHGKLNLLRDTVREALAELV